MHETNAPPRRLRQRELIPPSRGRTLAFPVHLVLPSGDVTALYPNEYITPQQR